MAGAVVKLCPNCGHPQSWGHRCEPYGLVVEAVEGVRLPYDKRLATERAQAGLVDLSEPSKLRRGNA